MSARTAPLHTPAELTFVTLDAAGEIAYFRSVSASNPAARNVTAYDITTDETYCFCKGAACGRTCWHVDHVRAAWRAVAHRVRCERMTVEDLVAHGQGLAACVMRAEAAGQPWIAGQLRERLDTARRVWRARRRAAARPARLPLRAAVALAA